MDWGANGRGSNDDTDAWQKAIDEVRNNAAYPPGETGRRPAGIVWAPAGRYTITRSLDFTTGGSLQGLGIWGEGQLQTFIQAELTEAVPALDMAGLSGAHLRALQIRGSKTSRASCAVLLAMNPRNTFHNRYPSLRDVWLELAADAPGAVAALVVAASDLAMLDNVVCSGPIGAVMGWRLPARCRVPIGDHAIADGFDLTGGDGLHPSDFVGYPVRITSGHGRGQIRQIAAFDPASRRVTIDRAWSPVPDASSTVEIGAVRSRYRLAQAGYDQTNYWIRNCQFVGKRAFVFTGGVAINVDDSYFAIVGDDAAPRRIISIEAQDRGEDQGPLTVHARGIRTENQSDEHRCYAITTAQPNVMLDISGELTVSPANDPTRSTGAILSNVAPGGFDCVKISGIAVGGAPMFDCSGDLFSLWSSFRADSPGRLDGRIGLAVADWRNGAADRQWTEFLLAHARVSLTPAGLLLGGDARVARSGWSPATPAGLPAIVVLAAAMPHYVGGSGLQASRIDHVPAGLIDGGISKARLHVQFYGHISATRIAVRIHQDTDMMLLAVPVPGGDSSFAVTIVIEVGGDRRVSAGGTITLASGASPLFATLPLDPGRDWSIECCVEGPRSDPAAFGLSHFAVS